MNSTELVGISLKCLGWSIGISIIIWLVIGYLLYVLIR